MNNEVTQTKEHNVGVAIVNYKTANLVIDCLESLHNELAFVPNLKVIVVDNDSPDDSFQVVSSFVEKRNWSNWITIKASSVNGGFAHGNNIAIKSFMKNLETNYIWLLNPDTFIEEKAGLSLVEFLEDNTNAGIAGSYQQDENRKQLVSTFNYPTPFGELIGSAKLGALDKLFSNSVIPQHNPINKKSYQWMSGASLMVKREVFEEVGLMDEKYFLYFEEVDFCFKAKKHGYSTHYIKESVISHYVGASTDITNVKQAKPQYWFDSRRRFFIKNYGLTSAYLADFNHLVGIVFFKIKQKIKAAEDDTPPNYLRDFIKFSSFFKGIE
jgi:hypothetical protein